MPTIEELCLRLKSLIDEKRPNALGVFTLELIAQVKTFLANKYKQPSPQVQVSLRDGESYRQRLGELGVRPDLIDGSCGMYIGDMYSGDIVIDLGVPKKWMLDGHVGPAMVLVVDMLMEEFMHALFPRIMDREMVTIRQQLTEEFLAPFKFMEEDRKAQIDAVAGEAKDGYFKPEFGVGPA